EPALTTHKGRNDGFPSPDVPNPRSPVNACSGDKLTIRTEGCQENNTQLPEWRCQRLASHAVPNASPAFTGRLHVPGGRDNVPPVPAEGDVVDRASMQQRNPKRLESCHIVDPSNVAACRECQARSIGTEGNHLGHTFYRVDLRHHPLRCRQGRGLACP